MVYNNHLIIDFFLEKDADWNFVGSYDVQRIFGLNDKIDISEFDNDTLMLVQASFEENFTKNGWLLISICFKNHFYLIEMVNNTFKVYNSLTKFACEDALFFFRKLVKRAVFLMNQKGKLF